MQCTFQYCFQSTSTECPATVDGWQQLSHLRQFNVIVLQPIVLFVRSHVVPHMTRQPLQLVGRHVDHLKANNYDNDVDSYEYKQ